MGARFDGHELTAGLVALGRSLLVSGFFNCVSFFTAPLRTLWPPGTLSEQDQAVDLSIAPNPHSACKQLLHCLIEVTVPVQPVDALNVPEPRLPDVKLVPVTVTPS